MEFSAGLKSLRQAKGLTQAQLADKSKVSRRTIIRWENGSVSPWIPELRAVLAVLEASESEAENLLALLHTPRSTRIQPTRFPGYGEFLKTFRKRSRQSTEAVAEKLGCDATTIVRWEKNQLVPSSAWLERIFSALNVESDEIEALSSAGTLPAPVSEIGFEEEIAGICWWWDSAAGRLFDVRFVDLLQRLRTEQAGGSAHSLHIAKAEAAYADLLCFCNRNEEAESLIEPLFLRSDEALELGPETRQDCGLIFARALLQAGGSTRMRRAAQVLDELSRRPLDVAQHSMRLMLLSRLRLRQDRMKEAVECSTSAIEGIAERRPEILPSRRLQQAQILLAAKDYEGALQALPEVEEDDPRQLTEFALTLASILRGRRREDDAVHWHRLALSTIQRFGLERLFPDQPAEPALESGSRLEKVALAAGDTFAQNG